ncbi:MAG: hypothetical protein ACYDCN_00460 [Bacteroidia bacterium]
MPASVRLMPASVRLMPASVRIVFAETGRLKMLKRGFFCHFEGISAKKSKE